jgi:hypothetical protein
MRRRGAAFAVAALVAGMLASAVNGELRHEWWFAFLSMDMLLAGMGVTAATAVWTLGARSGSDRAARFTDRR